MTHDHYCYCSLLFQNTVQYVQVLYHAIGTVLYCVWFRFLLLVDHCDSMRIISHQIILYIATASQRRPQLVAPTGVNDWLSID
jgi:hypothetical protein